VGRQLIVVSAAVIFSAVGLPNAFAQGKGGHRAHSNRPIHRNHMMPPGPGRMLHLSPEEQQAFRRNAERWLQMDPQQRQMLRDREQILRQRRKAEAEAFLRDSGLRLDNGAREQFEQRYFQERRRIEQSLHQEIEAKRQQELPELKERLRTEFQPHQASPGPSGKGK
jgi:hypothetical protein